MPHENTSTDSDVTHPACECPVDAGMPATIPSVAHAAEWPEPHVINGRYATMDDAVRVYYDFILDSNDPADRMKVEFTRARLFADDTGAAILRDYYRGRPSLEGAILARFAPQDEEPPRPVPPPAHKLAAIPTASVPVAPGVPAVLRLNGTGVAVVGGQHSHSVSVPISAKPAVCRDFFWSQIIQVAFSWRIEDVFSPAKVSTGWKFDSDKRNPLQVVSDGKLVLTDFPSDLIKLGTPKTVPEKMEELVEISKKALDELNRNGWGVFIFDLVTHEGGVIFTRHGLDSSTVSPAEAKKLAWFEILRQFEINLVCVKADGSEVVLGHFLHEAKTIFRRSEPPLLTPGLGPIQPFHPGASPHWQEVNKAAAKNED